MDTSSPVPSPGAEEASRILSRDYADQNLARSASQAPSQSQSRYAGFSFGPSTIRRRINSITSVNPSPGPAASWRAFQDSDGRSVAIATTSGRDADGDGRKFSLAGPGALETLSVNQPYVDPGYAQLNPAYDQPANVRPVWGLAKPLPRVLRPGMVPAKDELEKEAEEERDAHYQEAAPAPLTADLEAGRIEPTLRPDKIASQLDTIRRERELSLYRAYQTQFDDSPALSPFGVRRRTSDAPTETPQQVRMRPEDVIEEDPREQEPGEGGEQEQEPPDLDLPESMAFLKQAREEEDLKVPYQDAVPLPAYQAEDDEVHNLHTYWSVIRLRFREPLAELLGIMVQYTLGFSANLSMTVSRGAAGAGDTGTWAWGLATMLAIYVAGGISGAHLNPAISLMLYVYRGFPLGKVPVYVAAQMVGAFLAALVAFGIFRPGILALLDADARNGVLAAGAVVQDSLLTHTTRASDGEKIMMAMMKGASSSMLPSALPTTATILANFITSPRTPWVDDTTAFLTELTGTTILVISVLALGDDTNAPPGAGMNAFIVGLLVTVLGMSFGYNTGLAMNPARDFGPRVAMLALGLGDGKSLFADGYWFRVAWLGPLAGALLGGLLYDAAIFVGGESPVNYPTRRIQRAARKWQQRWRARFRRTKKAVKAVKDDVVGNGGAGYETAEG